MSGVLVRYIGPHDAVDVQDGPTRTVTVRRGEAVDVSPAIANGSEKLGTSGLLDQKENWELADKPAKAEGKK